MPQAALDLVLALFRDPGLVAEFRERALPGDIGQVIRIAAGEGAATDAAVEATGLPAETLGEACVFFLQQMLFAPGADSYRVLGALPEDPQERLREHYRWLMKWLHPDRNQDGWEAVYAERVTTAWQDLKTPDRRAEYDERAPSVALPMVPVSQSGWRLPVADSVPRGPLLSGRVVRNLPGIVLGTLASLAVLMVAATYWARSSAERHWLDREAIREPTGSQLVPEPPATTADAADPTPAALATDGGDPASTDKLPALSGEAVTSPDETHVSSQMLVLADDPQSPRASEAVAIAPDVATAPPVVALPPAAEAADGATELDLPLAREAAAPAADVATEPPVVALAAAAGADAIDPDLPLAKETVASAHDAETDHVSVARADPIKTTVSQPEQVATEAVAQAAPEQADSPPSPAYPPQAPAPASVFVTAPERRPASTAPALPPPAVSLVIAASPERSHPPVSAEGEISPLSADATSAGNSLVSSPARSEPDSVPSDPVVPTIAVNVPVPAPAESEPADEPAAPTAVANPVATQASVAPAQGRAEELVREFVAAYAAGDRGRFDRLVTASGRDQPALADMRRRFDTTEMRFLEISQVQWRLDADTAQASASFRDTYVPRGSRRAVTEAGRIAWEIRIENGNHRIAGLARNAAR